MGITRTTHFLLYCSAITSHLIPTIPLLYCINSSLLTAIYTARQLCAFRSLRQHASHLFYETITGSYCLATPEPSPTIPQYKGRQTLRKGWNRPCSPPPNRRPIRSRSRKEALPARKDGEERHAQYGASRPCAYGGCTTTLHLG